MSKILLVDDNPDVLTTLTKILTDAKHTVHVAENEIEALEVVINKEFDFALVDLHLHGDIDESGLTLTMALRKLSDRIRIIMMTGDKDVKPSKVAQAIRYHGAINFIRKDDKNYIELPQIIADAAEQLQYEKTNDSTRLSLTLEIGQPVTVRAYGAYVFSSSTWKILRLNIERYARRAYIAWNDPANINFHVKDIGKELWRELFRENSETQIAYAGAKDLSKPLTLQFEGNRELLRLPLEALCSEDPEEYLVLTHPFSRFIRQAKPKYLAISPNWLATKNKLNILIVASNTDPPIEEVDREVEQLAEFFKQFKFIDIDTKLMLTDEATLENVKSELQNDIYDIIHYAGHGTFNPDSPEDSSLHFWSDEREEILPLKASELRLLLESSKARLVYLSNCYGTATSAKTKLLDYNLLGLADAIVQAGIPSVLGFRWPVSDWGAREMAISFYRSLLKHGSPEIALWRARREIKAKFMADDQIDTTWLSPILVHQQ